MSSACSAWSGRLSSGARDVGARILHEPVVRGLPGAVRGGETIAVRMANEARRWVIDLAEEIDERAAGVVDRGLGEFNASAAPLHEVQALACFARTPEGTVIGGVVGRTWGLCCELQQLWVDPAYRHRGIASQLVRAFEGRAWERGCRTVYLETFSFQAPTLYRSLGYETRLELGGFAPGTSKFVMVYELQDPA
jgi:ribosomal protein S18 acetylase RimI-like enzyme